MSELRKVKNITPVIVFDCQCGARISTSFIPEKPENQEFGNEDSYDWTVRGRCLTCRTTHQFNVNVLYNG